MTFSKFLSNHQLWLVINKSKWNTTWSGIVSFFYLVVFDLLLFITNIRYTTGMTRSKHYQLWRSFCYRSAYPILQYVSLTLTTLPSNVMWFKHKDTRTKVAIYSTARTHIYYIQMSYYRHKTSIFVVHCYMFRCNEPSSGITLQKFKQDRQCTCKVTLRHVRVTTVAVEKQEVLHTPVYL